MNGSDGMDTLDRIERLEKMGYTVTKEPARVKADLNTVMDAYEAKIRRLEAELESYKKQSANLDNIIEDQTKTIEHLQTDNHYLNEIAGGYKNERDIMNEGYKNQKKEIDNLTTLYARYRTTAHRLYASLNEIAGEIKFERERIQMAHTPEEWAVHLPDGLTWIEESAPFTEEDWNVEEILKELDTEEEDAIGDTDLVDEDGAVTDFDMDAYMEKTKKLANRYNMARDYEEFLDFRERISEDDKLLTPDEFSDKVKGLIGEYGTDQQMFEAEFGCVVTELLARLGYNGGVMHYEDWRERYDYCD